MIETPQEAYARLREEWRRATSPADRAALAEDGKAVKVILDVFGETPPRTRAGQPDE